jgi:aspartokinase
MSAPTTNGTLHEAERIAHTEEKDLPGGWCVLKFGGTSVGKFAENIADICKYDSNLAFLAAGAVSAYRGAQNRRRGD